MRTLLSGSLNNAKTIADSGVHGIIHLVALSIMTEGGKSIDHFKSFALSQSAVTHHDFTLVLAHDSIGAAQNQNLENAQSFLGKRMTVTFTYKHIKNGPERSFTGVITGVAFSQQYGDYGDVVLTGQGPTILLDGAPHIQSFGGSQITRLAFIAQEMFQKALTTRFDFRVDCKSNNNLPYACQYNETQYNFLARTAEAYGEQFYYDGQTVHFGKLPEAEKPLELIYGRDVHEIQVQMNTRHVDRTHYGYNSSENQLLTTGKSNLNPQGRLAKPAFKISQNVFNTEALQPAPVRAFTHKDIEATQLNANAAAATQVSVIKGKTTVPFLYPGCMVNMEFKKRDSSKTDYFSKVMITEVRHSVNNIGQYSGHFEAISSDMGFMPTPKFETPQAQPQVATVVDNKNAEGRVQVKFKWNYDGEMTDYIRVMAPDAGSSNAVGKNRGFVFIPEIGDQVMVGFQHNHPDRPFVMGGLFHGQIGAGGGADNHKKSIYTRSGSSIVFDDTEEAGSITITDASGNVINLDGKGNINITASKQDVTVSAPETMTFNAKNIKLNASENIENNAGNNFTTKATNRIEESSKNIGLYAVNNLNIEAKQNLDLYGKKNVIAYSDNNVNIGAAISLLLHGHNAKLTAAEKLEYKAPNLDDLPHKGDFDFTKEAGILDVKWMDSTMENDITKITEGAKASIVVQTRNIETGKIVSIKAEETNQQGEIIEHLFSGTVNEDGNAELKEVFEHKKTNS